MFWFFFGKFLKHFLSTQLDCKAAYKRFEEGVPGASSVVDDSAKTIAETVQFFITAMVFKKKEIFSFYFILLFIDNILKFISGFVKIGFDCCRSSVSFIK